MPAAHPARQLLIAATLAAGLVSCGVLELGGAAHEAVALEDARSESGTLVVTVELLATEIGGATVVVLRVPVGEAACADGADLPDEGLALGSELVFVQDGDVTPGGPPEVHALDVQVDCG